MSILEGLNIATFLTLVVNCAVVAVLIGLLVIVVIRGIKGRM